MLKTKDGVPLSKPQLLTSKPKQISIFLYFLLYASSVLLFYNSLFYQHKAFPTQIFRKLLVQHTLPTIIVVDDAILVLISHVIRRDGGFSA
jgi:hypothetical protein